MIDGLFCCYCYFRPDRTLQDIVFKIVPGIYHGELKYCNEIDDYGYASFRSKKFLYSGHLSSFHESRKTSLLHYLVKSVFMERS